MKKRVGRKHNWRGRVVPLLPTTRNIKYEERVDWEAAAWLIGEAALDGRPVECPACAAGDLVASVLAYDLTELHGSVDFRCPACGSHAHTDGLPRRGRETDWWLPEELAGRDRLVCHLEDGEGCPWHGRGRSRPGVHAQQDERTLRFSVEGEPGAATCWQNCRCATRIATGPTRLVVETSGTPQAEFMIELLRVDGSLAFSTQWQPVTESVAAVLFELEPGLRMYTWAVCLRASVGEAHVDFQWVELTTLAQETVFGLFTPRRRPWYRRLLG